MHTAGPGPKYLLPPILGNEGTDVTKRSSPAFSLGPLLQPVGKRGPTPGPKYTFTALRTGEPFSPAPYLGFRFPHKKVDVSPGPNRYRAEDCPDVFHATPPAYSLGFRTDGVRRTRATTPGPKYLLPTTIGDGAPDLTAPPAFTLKSKARQGSGRLSSPGPAKYEPASLDLYKTKAPEYSIGLRARSSRKITPGPKYNPQFNERDEPPQYTFGVKHSPYQKILRTSFDTGDFYGF